MAQTFDIRFAKSAGLAGLFEAPANEYRWKGAGRLSIDATGVSIAVRRGLLTLFARATTRRIPTNSLIGVYREGNALRLEFSTRESARAVLPIWVGNRDAAAQIVTLLPTQRSVELEDGDPEPTRRYRFDRKLVAFLLIGAVALAVGALTLQRYFARGSRHNAGRGRCATRAARGAGFRHCASLAGRNTHTGTDHRRTRSGHFAYLPSESDRTQGIRALSGGKHFAAR